ncbi:puratrophin-1-like [Salvelinus sp. IW2-2015]|uniref:puratrophin-1-like n=1 Tax=Salvelinus sp. IW2-2015 TaxID=2691554 RepID=UPI0038D42FEC
MIVWTTPSTASYMCPITEAATWKPSADWLPWWTNWKNKLYLLWCRMLSSGKQYVAVLTGVEETYLPLLEGPDTPSSLRGEADLLFHNLASFSAFHSQYLLPAMEGALLQSLLKQDLFSKHSFSSTLTTYSKDQTRSGLLVSHLGCRLLQAQTPCHPSSLPPVLPPLSPGPYTDWNSTVCYAGE